MKTFYSLLFILSIISFTACDIDLGDMNIGSNSVKGEGNVKKEERKVESFSKISAATGLKVYVTMGNEEKVTVEADENLHDYIITEVKDGKLKIYSKHNINKAEAKNIYVVADDLVELDASSGADLSVDNEVSATKMELDASSGSNITVASLNATNCELNASSGARININGGNSTTLDVEASSGSRIESKTLQVKTCKANLSSSGDAYVNVSDAITYNGSSGSTLYYIGEPTIDLDVSSGAKIKKINDSVQ